MPSILKRTSFYDASHNQIRWFSWNLVVTTLGTMVEPRQLNMVSHTAPDWNNYNPQDELAKVTDIHQIDILKDKDVILGAGKVIHGGELVPQSMHYNPVN